MEQPSEQTATVPRSAKEVLELAGKVALALVGVAYVLGLFIVNFHFGMYGLRANTLLRADYVLAGGTWLFLFLLAGLLWRDLIRTAFYSRNAILTRLAILFIRLPIYALLVAFTFIAISAPGTNVDSAEMTTAIAITGLTPILLAYPLTVLVAVARLLLGYDKQQADTPTFALLFVGVVFVVALSLYSGGVYPLISPAYGGGASARVHVILANTTQKDVRAAFDEMLGTSGEAYLIADAPEWLVLAPQPGRSFERRFRKCIRLNRDDVATLTLRPPK
jgi:hypothetical protein